jgi:hypothetical protein
MLIFLFSDGTCIVSFFHAAVQRVGASQTIRQQAIIEPALFSSKEVFSMLETILLSSLHRVFPSHCPASAFHRLSGFQNEPLSFQLAYRLKEGRTQAVYPRIECPLPLRLYAVGYVPVVHTDVGLEGTPAPGLFGDMLLPFVPIMT